MKAFRRNISKLTDKFEFHLHKIFISKNKFAHCQDFCLAIEKEFTHHFEFTLALLCIEYIFAILKYLP